MTSQHQDESFCPQSRVLFVSDSRGKGVEAYTKTIGFRVDNRIRGGATLRKLGQIAQTSASKSEYDLIVIQGGICNLTKRETGKSGERLLQYSRGEEARVANIEDIKHTLQALRLRFGPKLIFCTVIPADLHSYLKANNNYDTDRDLREHLAIQQSQLIDDINDINRYIVSISRAAGRKTIEWHKFVQRHSKKRKRKGSQLFKPSVTAFSNRYLQDDGVHFLVSANLYQWP